MSVRMLVPGFADDPGQRQFLAVVVAAPAVMRVSRRGREQEEQGDRTTGLRAHEASLPGPRVAGPRGSSAGRKLPAELVGKLLDDRLGQRISDHLHVTGGGA